MKKMNNKGFAISTLIYGLAIMGIMIVAILMATMAQTRSNNKSLAKAIEEDLNRFSKTETSFKPIGSEIQSQEYIVPESGWYRIELWGAQGGGNGGKGAYTAGVIELDEGEVLYFYVGKKRDGRGGYSSEVRVENGGYSSSSSYETRIMVAAGGGSSSNASGGTLYGYDNNMESLGGFIKSQGSDKDFSLLPTSETNNTNGTLVGYSKNYAVSTATNPQIDVLVPKPSGDNVGGNGYFVSNNASTGGTSFIAGYAGCFGIKQGSTTSNSKLEYYEHSYQEEDGVGNNAYSDTKTGDYYFVDGIMLPGTHTGDGYAKISRVKPKTEGASLIRKNNKLDNIRYIRDCTNTENATLSKILVSSNGNTYTGTPSGTGTCRQVDLGTNINADEIAVFHGNSGVDYKDNTISVSSDGSSWQTIKGTSSNTQLSETETVSGYRVSAYQYDNTTSLPAKGNYIIQPVLSENRVLTAAPTAESNANPITIEPYNGEKRQIWSIELITDTKINRNYVPGNPSTYEYKIVELARFKALSITQDENIAFNTLSAIDKFNAHARNEPQIWKIQPVGNGTYNIMTVVDPEKDTGFILPQTNNSVSDAYNQIIIGKKNMDTARFKIIQVDYSSN